jgi:hypothetical protein
LLVLLFVEGTAAWQRMSQHQNQPPSKATTRK